MTKLKILQNDIDSFKMNSFCLYYVQGSLVDTEDALLGQNNAELRF